MESARKHDRVINNSFYDSLGKRWYEAQDDPVALLRAEAALRNPLVLERIRGYFPFHQLHSLRALDLGCGAGFLSNALAQAGLRVTGADLSPESLRVAEAYDTTRSVQYLVSDALKVPLPDHSYDVVCAMDLLEHVESAEQLIAEASRLLRPNGLFFFHTFNRTPLAWLLAVKGLEWVVKNTPKDLHVYRLFLRPRELNVILERQDLRLASIIGLKPVICSGAFFQLLTTGIVPRDFRFEFTRFKLVGYTGWARKCSLGQVQ